MQRVYVLQHVHTRDNGDEDVKFIGVYSSRENAAAAAARLAGLPGFAESADGFHTDEYPLDRDHWTEGYAAVPAVAPARV